MTLTNLRIQYPTAHETVQAKLADKGAYELTTHAQFLPLAPGDLVLADLGHVVRKVVRLEPQHVVEIQLAADDLTRAPTVAEVEATEAFFKDIHHHTWITRLTTWTFAVSGDQAWIDDRVLNHPSIEHHEVLRTTGFAINFDVAVQHPDLDGLRTGPWT